MDIEEYIASGILELYVAGLLSEKENEEVYANMMVHEEILSEVLKIEEAVLKLTAGVAPASSASTLNIIKEKIGLSRESDVITLPESKINWFNYVGWAASVVLAGGLIYVMVNNNELKEDLKTVETEKEFLEQQIELAKDDLKEAENLLAIMRDKNILAVPLAGQPAFQEAYAKVYWDKATNSLYLDAQGLPEPPEGKVYQLWSLTLNPLTPTSLGVIADFTSDDNKIFTIDNPNASEAFGITLEPEGGSPTPTMEQLYTLGVVASSP